MVQTPEWASVSMEIFQLKMKFRKRRKPHFVKSLAVYGPSAGTKIKGKKVEYVFIGSCTNSRIEDLRMVASFVKGKKKADNVEVWVVPGSKQVETQAKKKD